MAHHKRGKRKNARSGCLMCKCWKANGLKGSGSKEATTVQERRMRVREREQRAEAAGP